MTRRKPTKPRAWKCALCTAGGISTDPARDLEDHYYETHHTPAPF